MGENFNMPKGKFRLCVTIIEKVGEGENASFKEKETIWSRENGKSFRQDFYSSNKNGEHLTVEIVNEKPTQFKINQIYMLRTRDVVWIWVEDKEADEAI